MWGPVLLIRLDLAELKPLEDRRVELKLGLLYKILNDLCFFPDGSWEFRNHWSSRTAHPKQLAIPFAHTNSYFYSFFPHTSSTWNTLDNKCVLSESYSSFMHNLRRQYLYHSPHHCINPHYPGAHSFSFIYYCASYARSIKYYKQKLHTKQKKKRNYQLGL